MDLLSVSKNHKIGGITCKRKINRIAKEKQKQEYYFQNKID